MTKPIERDAIYRGRGFQTKTIELCVRWYITYRLSYRDLAAMMAERGVVVSHTTIMRWVLHYVPEYERRWNRFARPVIPPGEWMRLRFPSGVGFTICIGQSTNTETQSDRCYARIAERMPRRRFLGRRSRALADQGEPGRECRQPSGVTATR